jgi:putative FmdB family regulatory protein
MPIYEYEPLSGDCGRCNGRFEIFAKLSDPELSHCPHCQVPVRRAISAPAVHSGTAHLLNDKHAASRGFTQYRKVGGGVYEKAYGEGPRYISDDGGPTSVD